MLDNAAEAVDNKELLSDIKQRVVQNNPSLPDSKLCKICFKEKLEVIFVPCGHVIACIECAVTLDECALCREPLVVLMRVYLGNEMGQSLDLDRQLLEKEVSDVKPESSLCKVCLTEEISVAFIPCRHINTCEGCIAKLDRCPVCSEPFFAFMQAFL